LRRLLAAPLALIALAAAGCGSGTEGLASGGDETRGKELFQERCAQCHALQDAGSQSQVGPDLDDAFAGIREEGFSEDAIRQVVHDQIKYAVPPMPQDLVTGSDADDVAAYLAAVAGVQGYTEGPAAGGGEGDGASIFASAGCGSCHTLAAASATGTVGPDLDASQPSVELAIERVTKGMGAMPPFEGQLSEDEIRAVAEFVAENAGR
jgi:mono/diheme cytochrome c family protein